MSKERNKPREWMTVTEAAQVLGIPTPNLRYYIREGILPATRHSGLQPYLVKRADLHKVEERLRKKSLAVSL